jgi:hypothetical protein
MTHQSDMMQEAFGVILFAIVVIWAAYKIMNTPLPKDEDDDDIHLGI